MQGKVFYANRGSRVGGERLKGGVEKREGEREGEGEGSYRVLRYMYLGSYSVCSTILCCTVYNSVRSGYVGLGTCPIFYLPPKKLRYVLYLS